MGSVIIKNIKSESSEEKIKRIGVYCRVSTGLEEQQSSLKNQTEAFARMISAKKQWKLAGIYADEGFSGTQAAYRPEFQRLMKDCREGKIDIIITKSISRFARNTLECISCIRELKEMGVSIIFEENGLDTGTETSELILSILAAVAQEESRTISTNVKWSLEKKFREGRAKWSSTYGYKKEKEQEFVVDKATAPVVQRIFEEYYKGASLPAIAEGLEKDHVPTPDGKTKWWPKVIDELLKNEKYIGDALCQKTYTIDHLTHRRVKNLNAEAAASYYIKNHHEPLVSRELFDHVQVIFSLKDKRHGVLQYPYHQFLRCPHCGKPMRKIILKEHGRPGAWNCSEACSFYLLYEHEINQAFMQAFSIYRRSQEPLRKKKPEYYMLAETVCSIEFPGSQSGEAWEYLKANWKDGTSTCIRIRYKRERDIPGSEAQRHFYPEGLSGERSKCAGNCN